jgi:hypothetical protein
VNVIQRFVGKILLNFSEGGNMTSTGLHGVIYQKTTISAIGVRA